MCGIIAVLRRVETRPVPAVEEVTALITSAFGGDLSQMVTSLATLDELLRGVPGVRFLIEHPEIAARLDGVDIDAAQAYIRDRESQLDAGQLTGADGAKLSSEAIEALNAELIRAKDLVWALRSDRVVSARRVRDLAGAEAGTAAIRAFTSVQQALSALDRLEVRGRDSAGLSLVVADHGLDITTGPASQLFTERTQDPLHRSGSVSLVDGGQLSFVYKAAAAIGELGDNTSAIRSAIASDELLHMALRNEAAQVVVIGHTRWASVGIISEPNAHPLNSCEVKGIGVDNPEVLGVLNGDVDNFADLIAANNLDIAPEISTDAKVIPTLMARQLAQGLDEVEAFRCTVAELEGSVAIASHAAGYPERLLLALRGSGQALYVGLADDCFIVASEPYGVIEETSDYVRMDGETPADLDNPVASRGQILALDMAHAGTIDGIARLSYDGTTIPVTESDIATAQITTRDIDRGDYPHFLLKEINEAPDSFHKTLRGRLIEKEGRLRVVLGNDNVPQSVRDALRSKEITRAIVIGQGTAAVAGESAARALRLATAETHLQVEAKCATELSGFEMRADMSDTLIIAISQSGTTTDTNRTVDLVRGRGAKVISIVNRRGSDLTDKSDGVLYTSDGRDVEMSVASTKAFYSQVAAGFLLAEALAAELGVDPDDPARQELLGGLRDLPQAMRETLELSGDVAAAASQFAPSRRYWAIVGNGLNRIAAQEVRIKLSELCYKSIAADVTEDKKHIDLSSEPMILVCATGLSGSTATDVAKEVAIYRAHKAAPIVIASQGDEHFGAALSVIAVPWVTPNLGFILSAMVGHLFGYEAALAIDAQAIPLRQASMAVEGLLSRRDVGGEALLRELRREVANPAGRFLDGLRAGDYNGHLEAGTAFQLSSLYRYVLGTAGLDAYQAEFGKVGTPSVVIEDFTKALIRATEELTRPIDAIKHQAKTVTVGISRSDESLMQVELVRHIIDVGASRDRLSYATLKTLAALDPAINEVVGFTRYRLESEEDGEPARSMIVDRGGVSLRLKSRTETDPQLRGTKRRVASERRVLVTRGASDDRTIVLIPEVKDNETTGITLLHVSLNDELAVATARSVLSGYRRRYDQLRDMVTETEPVFRDDLLATVAPLDLLTQPIGSLAQRWRQPQS